MKPVNLRKILSGSFNQAALAVTATVAAGTLIAQKLPQAFATCLGPYLPPLLPDYGNFNSPCNPLNPLNQYNLGSPYNVMTGAAKEQGFFYKAPDVLQPPITGSTQAIPAPALVEPVANKAVELSSSDATLAILVGISLAASIGVILFIKYAQDRKNKTHALGHS